jgi:hypothetical protein
MTTANLLLDVPGAEEWHAEAPIRLNHTDNTDQSFAACDGRGRTCGLARFLIERRKWREARRHLMIALGEESDWVPAAFGFYPNRISSRGIGFNGTLDMVPSSARFSPSLHTD